MRKVIYWLVSAILFGGVPGVSYAERICNPVDQFGKPCISDPEAHYFENNKYVSLRVTNSCDIGLHVYAYPKNGDRFGSLIVTGRHSVGYCETKKCGGFSKYAVLCPAEKPRLSSEGGRPARNENERQPAASAPKAEKLDQYARRLKPEHRKRYAECVAHYAKSSIKTDKIEYDAETKNEAKLYSEPDRSIQAAARKRAWPIYAQWLDLRRKSASSKCFFDAQYYDNIVTSMELFEKTPNGKKMNALWQRWFDSLSHYKTGARTDNRKKEDAAWERRKAEINADYDRRHSNLGGGSDQPCTLGHKPGDPDPCR